MFIYALQFRLPPFNFVNNVLKQNNTLVSVQNHFYFYLFCLNLTFMVGDNILNWLNLISF